MIPKLLGEIVRKLEPGSVTVTVDDEAHISGGGFTTSLRLKAADEYPRLGVSQGQGVRIDAAAFAGALRQVVRAASKDDLRPILTGVLIAAQPGGLRLVATDSYRLAMRDLRGISMLAEGRRCSSPRRAWPRCSDSPATARSRSCSVSARSRSARRAPRSPRGSSRASSPNYEQLIPSGYPNRLTVAKDAFRDAVERVMIVGQGRDNAAVRLTMGPGGLELSMVAQDVGSSSGSVEAKFEGTELAVAFNPQFLLEGIDAIEGAEVALETVDPLKPATLRSADGGDFMYLLMPVRTS